MVYGAAALYSFTFVLLWCQGCTVLIVTFHYASNSCDCMGINKEAFQLCAVYKKLHFLLQVTWESISILQVTQESVSGTSSHMCCFWMCNEIECSYDKIIITILRIKRYQKKYYTFFAIGIVTYAVHILATNLGCFQLYILILWWYLF